MKMNSDKAFDTFNGFLLLLLVLCMLYPLYFVVIASFSDPKAVVTGTVFLWPKGFILDGYKAVFQNRDIWNGYRNSIIYTIAGTLFALFMTIPAAYALSKKDLKLRGLVTTYFLITMFFSGGLLPSYLTVKNLKLLDKPYTLIILGAFSVYNMIVARTYFTNSIPNSLYEAAEIDGCSEFRKFVQIALPLAKPIIAVIALYYAVAKWNDYFTALVYIRNRDFMPLQLVLKNILLESSTRLSTVDTSLLDSEELLHLTKQAYIAEAMKYCVILVSSLPMLIAYPFVQKYFVKGVMIGSIKG